MAGFKPSVRTHKTTLGGKPVSLSASFQTLDEIAERVGDPITILREMGVEALAIKAGLYQYQPKFRFTVENVANLLHIGISHAGGDMTLEQVKDAIFCEGLESVKDKAENYLVLNVTPETEQEVSGKEPSTGE